MLLLTGEHRSGAAESCHDLVEDEKNPGFVAFFSESGQEPFRPGPHSCGALDEGFDGGSGNQAFSPRGESVEFFGIGDSMNRKFVAFDFFMEGPYPSNTGRAESVAVVGIVECHEPRAVWIAGELVELDSHLHRRLDGCGSVVTQERTGERVVRKKSAKFFRESDGGSVRGSQEGNMGDEIELFVDGASDVRVRVAVDVCPNRGVCIEVAAASAVLQHRAFTAHEDEWFVTGIAPVAHLGEWMPEVAFVEFGELFRVPNIWHGAEL